MFLTHPHREYACFDKLTLRHPSFLLELWAQGGQVQREQFGAMFTNNSPSKWLMPGMCNVMLHQASQRPPHAASHPTAQCGSHFQCLIEGSQTYLVHFEILRYRGEHKIAVMQGDE
jgi:hypothetical protein